MTALVLPPPILQISFGDVLRRVRNEYLMDALRQTVKSMEIAKLDDELSASVPNAALARLAASGLRGELMFAVPYTLETNPRLLGYYRLLLGYSQKAFYNAATGLSPFAKMEQRGTLGEDLWSRLSELCSVLINSSVQLLNGLKDPLTVDLLDDLSVLTLGSQLRGSNNVTKGTHAIAQVFELIRDLIGSKAVGTTKNSITLINAAGREVLVQFASDPDIVVRERIAEAKYKNLVAIEVKGGQDFSNIHNRIGEAEKSHQKAKADGYIECWTIVNVDNIDLEMARKESPSTNQFYLLSQLVSKNGPEWDDFRSQLISLLGIPS